MHDVKHNSNIGWYRKVSDMRHGKDLGNVAL